MSISRRLSGWLLVLALLFLVSPAAFSQSERGTLTGTILDTTGASVPGARVAITNTATNLSVQVLSTDSGDYTAANLPVGEYSVRIENLSTDELAISRRRSRPPALPAGG
jgi:hypothetical protein